MMAAGTATLPDADFPKRQIDIVMDDPQVFRRQLVIADETSHSKPAVIHEGKWFGQDHIARARNQCFALIIFCPRDSCGAKLPPKLLNHHKPDIMPGAFVLPAGIAKTNNKLHIQVEK